MRKVKREITSLKAKLRWTDPKEREAQAARIKAAWARKTPEERAKWKAQLRKNARRATIAAMIKKLDAKLEANAKARDGK